MRNLLILLGVCLSIVPVLNAQDHHQTIKQQYEEHLGLGEMDPADFEPELLLKYTYPPLIDLMGGKEKYLQLIEAGMAMGEDEDDEEYYEDEEEGPWTLRESVVEVGEIGPVYQQGNELQAVVEVKEIERFDERDDIYYSYKLAISRDNGNFWYFIDGTMLWNKVVPDLHPSIVQKEEKEETIFK